MKVLKLLGAAALLTCLFTALGRAGEDKDLNQDVQSAIESFNKADSTMKKLFDKATGYVVFPSIGKGGFIFGGAHGKGLVYEKGKLIGEASLTQITVGAQIGGQEYSEVVFFEDKKALGHFKESNIEISAQVSAVAAAEGVSQNAKYVNGVMVFTRAKTGLMAEASVGGQKLKFKPLGR
jgi:lipid-binding SYLF domain-containing protein